MNTYRLLVCPDSDAAFNDSPVFDRFWRLVGTVQVPTIGDHSAEWKRAKQTFSAAYPQIMREFGNGCIAIVRDRN